jgi:hypothetical protein
MKITTEMTKLISFFLSLFNDYYVSIVRRTISIRSLMSLFLSTHLLIPRAISEISRHIASLDRQRILISHHEPWDRCEVEGRDILVPCHIAYSCDSLQRPHFPGVICIVNERNEIFHVV